MCRIKDVEESGHKLRFTAFLTVIQQDQQNSRKNEKLIPMRKIVFKALIQIRKGRKDMLAGLVEDSEKKSESLKAQCEKAELEVESSKTLIKDLNDQYDEIISWSSLYDSATMH